MRKPSTASLFSLAAAAALLLSACGDKTEPGTRLQFSPVTFTVGAGLNPILAHSFQIRDVSTEHDRFMRETGNSWGEWSSVVPERASLLINEPGLSWGFAYEVSVQAYGDNFNQRREIFYRDQIRIDVGSRLDLVPSEADFRELLDAPTVNLIIEFKRIGESPSQSIPATLIWSFSARE